MIDGEHVSYVSGTDSTSVGQIKDEVRSSALNDENDTYVVADESRGETSPS